MVYLGPDSFDLTRLVITILERKEKLAPSIDQSGEIGMFVWRVRASQSTLV